MTTLFTQFQRLIGELVVKAGESQKTWNKLSFPWHKTNMRHGKSDTVLIS